MTVTSVLRQQIKAAAREHVSGQSLSIEVGLRGGFNANTLKWTEDDDLDDLWTLDAVRAIDDDPRYPGRHALDLYVTAWTGSKREQRCNVYVYIHDGQVVGATSDELQVGALATSLGFPDNGW